MSLTALEAAAAATDIPVDSERFYDTLMQVAGPSVGGAHGRAGFTLASLDFCGKTIDVPEIEFAVMADNWESTEKLAAVTRENISLRLADDPRFRAILRNDTESEYDAENLCTYLEARVAAGTLVLSPEFMKFEKAWRRDEMNHALGFAIIESLLYKSELSEIFAELRTRVPKFGPLEKQGFFEDEFTTAVVIAYDEISTARSYWEDIKERYPHFDNPTLVEWITKVAADESHHFQNIVNVIKLNHPDRIAEIPALVQKILDHESSAHSYEATFVLDHTGEQFTGDFISAATRILLKQFGFTLADLPAA